MRAGNGVQTVSPVQFHAARGRMVTTGMLFMLELPVRTRFNIEIKVAAFCFVFVVGDESVVDGERKYLLSFIGNAPRKFQADAAHGITTNISPCSVTTFTIGSQRRSGEGLRTHSAISSSTIARSRN